MKLEIMTLKELQECEKEILDVFYGYCEENGLDFFLCGGSLLGAIRHKGFIPWDDDIDVMMPRPDFDRLIALMKKSAGMIDEYRKVDARALNPDSPTTCIRVFDTRTKVDFENYRIPLEIGCWIDVFPLDGVEDDEKERLKHFRRVRRTMDLFIICLTKIGGKRRSRMLSILQYGLVPFVPFIRMVGYRRYLEKVERLLVKCDYDKSNIVSVIAGRGAEKDIMVKKDMWPRILVDFEGRKYPTMKNYEVHLTNLYGDYMTPPKAADRKSRHKIKIYRITEE